MRGSARSSVLYIVLGAAGFVAVALAWIRFGDLPTFLQWEAEERGAEVSSPHGLRTAQVTIRQTAERSFMGLRRESAAFISLRVFDKQSGLAEVWALHADGEQRPTLRDLTLEWASEDRVRLVGASSSVLTFTLARRGEK